MKVKPRQLSEKDRIETLDALYTAASSIKGRDAVKLFLRDLLSESERVMLGRRILVARRLIVGTKPHDIAIEMNVGLDTVYKVKRWLDDTYPGYEQAIQAANKEFKRRSDARTVLNPGDKGWLKKKYPLHFLLFP